MGYVSTVIIALVSILEIQNIISILLYGIPTLILILFLHVIMTDMEITFKDVAYTLLGICYVTIFIMFMALIMNLEHGNIYFGYTIVVAWSTDIFAYLVGRSWGNHHFSKVSPKKSVEGCIAGIIGTIVISLIYVYIANRYWNLGLEISYLYIAIASLIYSIISQIGDFIASSIKRFADIKDYGKILPGHGGMLDRVDSLIFIAPFIYLVISLI